MQRINNKTCEHNDCKNKPKYGLEKDTARYCEKHKNENHELKERVNKCIINECNGIA